MISTEKRAECNICKAPNNGTQSQREVIDLPNLDSPNKEAPRWRLYLLTATLGLGNLLGSIDTTILGPALPAITTEFQTLDHIGWYTSAYLLTFMSSQVVSGKLIALYDPKPFFISSISVFEVGTIVCAAAPISPVFILGRAVAGVGAGGMVAASFAIMAHTPMRERPRLLALFFAIQSMAYTAGPSMSGALTDSYLTWRFNFWINLPLGFVAIITSYLVIQESPSNKPRIRLTEKLTTCDPSSAAILVALLILLFLALEWGSSSLSYSSPQVWGCFLGSGILAVTFVVMQVLRKDHALVPIRLLTQRTMASCCIFSLLYGAANMTHVTLFPTYLQTVHSITPTMSGVYQLVITISNISSMAIASFFISSRGHYFPFLCAGPLIYLVGSVMFQQLRKDSSMAWYIGAEVPIGTGFGLAMHCSLLAIQNTCQTEDVALAAVTEVFSQQLGRAVGISIAQSVFVRSLQEGLVVAKLNGNDAELVSGIAGHGLEDMLSIMPTLTPTARNVVREVLNDAVTTAFILPVVATATAAIVVAFVDKRPLNVAKGKSRVEGSKESFSGMENRVEGQGGVEREASVDK